MLLGAKNFSPVLRFAIHRGAIYPASTPAGSVSILLILLYKSLIFIELI
jgi:hypothetical protein